jgi:hypothetical protein
LKAVTDKRAHKKLTFAFSVNRIMMQQQDEWENNWNTLTGSPSEGLTGKREFK